VLTKKMLSWRNALTISSPDDFIQSRPRKDS
jgi:hypothetical protein